MTTPTHIGKYAVIDRVGAGGMAEVFLCRQSGLGGFDKIVIIKRILPNLLEDPEFVNMFLDEARLAANLNHPNIVQVFEIDEADGVPFIVMEFVRGPTLSQVLRTALGQGKIHYGHVAKLLSGVCEGLSYAHGATDSSGQPLGLVHRDVSPHNVIISMDGTPKLLDFGVAKAKGRLATSQVGMLKGKLRFMAPEQITSADGVIDQRADVYSIGVCLYLGTVGMLPFRGETDAAVMHAVLKEPLVPPSTTIAGYPPELEKLVLWAMARDPAERCPDAAQLHQALEDFVASGPYGSSKRAVAAWLAELLPDLDKLSAGQLKMGGATPSGQFGLPGTPVSSRKLMRPELQVDVDLGTAASVTPSSSRRAPLIGAALLALLALGAGLFALLRPVPVPAPVVAAPPVALPAPGQTDADKNAAARAYVTEAERLLAQHRYKATLDILKKGRALNATDPAVNIALARLEDQAELDAALARARELQGRADHPGAIQAAREVLDRDPENADARALLAELQPIKPTPAPSAGAAQVGSLLVTSKPEATVYIDDEPSGKTPLRLPRVSAGPHTIEVRAKGFTPAQREVKVERGKETKVNVVLVAAAVAPVVAAPVAVPKEPVKSTGVLVVTSKPEASVSLDGQPAGRTPLRSTTASVGGHLVEVREPGHLTQSRRVEVTSDGEAVAAFELVAESTPAPVPVAVAVPGPAVVKKPRLPATYTAHSVKDVARVLLVVEGEAVASGGQPQDKVSRTTAALMDELGNAFAPGQNIELFPRGMYYLIVSEASKGTSPAAIAERLKAAHLRNELADYKP